MEIDSKRSRYDDSYSRDSGKINLIISTKLQAKFLKGLERVRAGPGFQYLGIKFPNQRPRWPQRHKVPGICVS
ncbi:hypothetical protein MRB53_009748 [Persea americana]|uniref:Uncharacterized protein n=1 Tax=Persea americana TaxID=3435 RepID=A0ACC2LR27_PERAE|nr:hypothetical protein MRB53_009748 [Persea americana]